MQEWQPKVTPFAKIKVVFFLVSIFILSWCHAQSTLGGMHGHLIVPDAYTFNENAFVLGTSLYPGKHLYIDRFSRSGRINNELYSFATINFIEWLDLSFCITRIIGVENELNGIGDRSLNAKVRLVKEGNLMPSIAIMLEAPGGDNNYLASNSIVASKIFNNFQTTVGWGTPYILDRKIKGFGSEDFYGSMFNLFLNEKPNNYLKGILLAASYNYLIKNQISLKPTIEFDGRKFNSGLQLYHTNFGITLYFPGFNSFSMGLNTKWVIH